MSKDGTKRGRPPVLRDPEIFEGICKVVATGASYKTAAASVGVGESSLYQWLRLAKEEGTDPIYAAFANALMRARGRGEAALVGMVHRAARGEPIRNDNGDVVGYTAGDWRAAQWLLSVRDPENYSQSQKVMHSGPKGEPLAVQLYVPVEDDPDEDEPG